MLIDNVNVCLVTGEVYNIRYDANNTSNNVRERGEPGRFGWNERFRVDA